MISNRACIYHILIVQIKKLNLSYVPQSHLLHHCVEFLIQWRQAMQPSCPAGIPMLHPLPHISGTKMASFCLPTQARMSPSKMPPTGSTQSMATWSAAALYFALFILSHLWFLCVQHQSILCLATGVPFYKQGGHGWVLLWGDQRCRSCSEKQSAENGSS